ncbi:hypothetical protein ACWY4P_53545 (plasmid) [Streptomyces sp. LZ34]
MTEQQYQAVIRSLEDEAQQSRGFRARTVAFIQDPTHDLHTRQALAEHLGLPAPRQEAP